MDKLSISIIQTDPAFLNTLGLTGGDKNSKLGLLMFVFTISYAFSNLFWGIFIDKLGARKTALLGVTIWMLTMVMGGLSTSYGMFMASRILLGISEGIMIPVSSKFIANWFNQRELGRAQASWIIGNYLGPAIGALMLGAIIASLSWQSAFYFLAICNLLIIIPVFLFLTRETPEEHPRMSDEEISFIRKMDTNGQVQSKQNFTNDYRYWLVWIGNLMNSFLFFGLTIWLPTYLIEAKGFSREAMGGITSVSFLFALVFVGICGFLSDKTKRPGLLATMLFASCSALLLFSTTTSSSIIAASCMAIAIGTIGGIFHLTNLFTVKFSTPQTAGRAAGLMGFTNIMGGFSSYIMGWMRDVFNGDFGLSIMILIVAAGIGFFAYLFTLKKESEEVRLLTAVLSGDNTGKSNDSFVQP